MSDFENIEATEEIEAPPPMTNGNNIEDVVEESIETVTVNDGEDVMAAILGNASGPSMENLNLNTASNVSPPTVREEPECLKAWKVEQEALLKEKDANENQLMEEMREKAKKELNDWYKKYEDNLNNTKEENRKSEKTFVAEMDEITPGTEWERVNKLCDFNTKNSRNAKDQSRMRSILLQLKQNPKPVLAE